MQSIKHNNLIDGERRLLVLDDDVVTGSIVASMGEKLGMDVRTSDAADIFFRDFATWKPTHIVVDLMMPCMDGVEILLELARHGCDSRIVITSRASPRILDAAQRASKEHGLNISGCLAKPFTFERFKRLLNREPPSIAPKANGAVSAFEVEEGELRQAIARGEIKVVFQPKIHTANSALSGFEALARWRHPIQGPIPPSAFIPAAEKFGLIGPLTEVVFKDALGWFASLAGFETLSMAVNVSAQTLADIELADRLTKIALESGVEPCRIILEVTETSAMADPATAIALATRLRLKGFLLSIDDFGIGYSSLAQLARLPFSELKIDASFVSSMASNQESLKIVRVMIELSHSLGLQVTAEGVEDAFALTKLKELRCDMAQGYFIARPMPREAIPDWIYRKPAEATEKRARSKEQVHSS